MIYIYIFLLVCLILVFIPFKIQTYYEFTEISRYKITITYLFGLLKKEFESDNKEITIDNNKNNKHRKYKINYLDFTQYFIDKGNISKLYFRTNIGFKDPNILGISIGIIWSLINIVFGYFLRNNDIDKIKEKDIQVIPLFNQDIFEIFFLCIIKVNLVYIIKAYIRISKIRKGGDSIARTSNRRINENYNE
ncbi:DUF2953 domain-containing protein [Tissierella sp.]|uniref:DUF2953 domain-containing protein n=1 Tax=Tissierella sp. TaxID=41274 RepID=UPI0028572DDD|nr:DUF2953 domain-containing protein [Tissierella sp.]MDR7856170.1 DUF2953 domain-containing protein [Tissierella sp.]